MVWDLDMVDEVDVGMDGRLDGRLGSRLDSRLDDCMSDRIDELFTFLRTPGVALDYLGDPSRTGGVEDAGTVDPLGVNLFQIVSEWIALRQELKQQTKVAIAAQTTLQAAVDALTQENEHLRAQLAAVHAPAPSSAPPSSPPSLPSETASPLPKALVLDLLKVADNLEHALTHFAQVTPDPDQPEEHDRVEPSRLDPEPASELDPGLAPVLRRGTPWQRFWQWFMTPLEGNAIDPSWTEPEFRAAALPKPLPHPYDGNAQNQAVQAELAALRASDREGLAVIQRSLGSALQAYQIEPIESQGQPFDARWMYAIGREPSTTQPPNTVVQTVVTGYRWKGQLLREAQVIVAIAPT